MAASALPPPRRDPGMAPSKLPTEIERLHIACAAHQSLSAAILPLLLPNNQGEPCISSVRDDGFGSQIHQLIHHRIVAEALHVPFCPWRLIEPFRRTLQLHPRAGSVEWTNQLNICGLPRLLAEDQNKDGDCKNVHNCYACPVCNCPRLNKSGVYDVRLENRILKKRIPRHINAMQTFIATSMTASTYLFVRVVKSPREPRSLRQASACHQRLCFFSACLWQAQSVP